MDKVEVEILGLSSSPSSGGAYALLLKEIYGSRRLPIIIGSFEAQAIALELEGIKPPRPLTHDLVRTIIETLGASAVEIIISDLIENTFYAQLILEVSSLTHTIDLRPSDALAISVRLHCPIYVAETVMKNASFIPSSNLEDFPETEEEITKEEDKPDINTETDIANLQDQLRQAIEKEDYEKAAILRDQLNHIRKSN